MMFELREFSKHKNANDWWDLEPGRKHMEKVLSELYEKGFKPYAMTSTETTWEVLIGPKE